MSGNLEKRTSSQPQPPTPGPSPTAEGAGHPASCGGGKSFAKLYFDERGKFKRGNPGGPGRGKRYPTEGDRPDPITRADVLQALRRRTIHDAGRRKVDPAVTQLLGVYERDAAEQEQGEQRPSITVVSNVPRPPATPPCAAEPGPVPEPLPAPVAPPPAETVPPVPALHTPRHAGAHPPPEPENGNSGGASALIVAPPNVVWRPLEDWESLSDLG